jgi:hypothetical protein
MRDVAKDVTPVTTPLAAARCVAVAVFIDEISIRSHASPEALLT